jgi:hypothetical protein
MIQKLLLSDLISAISLFFKILTKKISSKTVLATLFLAFNFSAIQAQCNSGATAASVTSLNSTICIGTTDVFWSTGWGGGTWSSSNPSILQVTGTPDGRADVKGLASGTANVIYTLTQPNCPDIKTSQKTITVYGTTLGAIGDIVGTLTQCNGNTNQVYSVPAVTNAATYTWTFPTGWSIVSGQNTNSVTVNVGSGSGKIKVTVSSPCATSSSKEYSVTVNTNKTAKPTITPSATAVVCAGGSTTLTSSLQDNYLWSTGATTRAITVTAAGSYSVKTTKSTYCESDSSDPVTVTVIAAPTFTTSPGTTVCANTDVTYTTQTGKANYVWSVPGTAGTDYTITTGGIGTGSNSVTLKWKTGGNKTVTVNYNTGCTFTPPSSTTTVNSFTAGLPSATPQVCIGNLLTPITHTVNGVTGISSSTALPTGVTAALSSDKSTITISGTPSQSGIFDYTITLLTSCGNITATGKITVNAPSVGSTPTFTKAGVTSSTQAICRYSQPTDITLSGYTGTIQWQQSTDNTNFNNINLATSNVLTSAQIGNVNEDRYYRAVVTNGGCTSVFSTVATVTIITVADRGRAKGGQHICPGEATPPLTVYYLNGPDNTKFAETDKILRWDYSDDPAEVVWQPVPGSANKNTIAPTEILTALRTYRAVISNGCAEEYSIQTRVDVDITTAITAQSAAAQSKCRNTAFLPISVTAIGTRNAGQSDLQYQWYSNLTNSNSGGNSLAAANGARTNTYTPQSGTVGTLYYYCIVTAKCGTATSAVSGAFLTSDYPATPTATVTTQPTCTVPTGTITVTAPTGTGITYSINGTDYYSSGIFTLVAQGSYTVSVKNSTDCITPMAVPLQVQAPVAKTWTGATSTSWSIASNWSPSGIPTDSDCVIIPSGITNNPIISGTASNFYAYTLTVNDKASLTVKSGRTLRVTDAVTVLSSATTTGALTFEDSANLMQTSTSNNINSGNITYIRNSMPIRQSDYVYWSTPVKGQTLAKVSPLTGAGYYFGYNGTQWVSTPKTTVMTVGKGYIIRGPDTFLNSERAPFSASFIGVPNNGNISGEAVVANNFYLIGNPYPSALDADAFIMANTLLLQGTLSFWTHNTPVDLSGAAYEYKSDDYAAYNLSGGTGTSAGAGSGTNASGNNPNTPSGQIGAGQSFFAKVVGSGTITFNNLMRTGGNANGQFFKPGNTSKTTALEKHRLWLDMTNAGGAFKQMLVGYIEGATNATEKMYDGVSMDGNKYIDFYSINEGENLVIQGRALPFADTDLVPLGYRTTVAGDFTISLDQADGNLSTKAIYLEDKTTGTINDLHAGNYTFTTEIGTFQERFVLRYTNKTLGTGDFENIENGILVSVKDKTVKVLSSKETIKEVSVYDISGKVLYNKNKIDSNELQISNLQSSNQALIVKVTLENDYTVSKKIIFN